MTVEYRTDSTNTKSVKMTHCPFCGEEFTEHGGMGRVTHLRDCEEADDAREIQR